MIHMSVLMYSIVEMLTDTLQQKNKDLRLENETIRSEKGMFKMATNMNIIIGTKVIVF